jgi:predicted nucleotidyltransferase
VRRLAVFGSILREDFNATSSDIDLVVDFRSDAGASAAHQYFDFKAALEQLFGRRVDLVELDAMRDSRLKRIIERSQVEVYAEAT